MTTSKLKRSLLAASALVALAALALHSDLLAPHGAELRGPLARVPTGKQHVYELVLTTKVSAKEGVVAQYRVSGEWTVQNSAQHAGRVHTRVLKARVTSELGDPSPESRARLEADFASPIELALDAKDLIEEVREHPRTLMQVRSLQKSIVAMAQLAREDAGKESWKAEESDATGQYLATYRRRANGVSKEKQSYTSLAGVTPQLAEKADVVINASSVDMEFRAGDFVELSAREELYAEGDYVDGINTQTSLKLRFLREEPAASLERVSPQLERAALASFALSDGFSVEADQARVAGRTVEDMVETLNRLPAFRERDEEQRNEGRKAFIGLAAKFRLDDSAVDLVLEEIEDGAPAARSLWDALASAGTPRAQAALRSLIDDPQWSMPDRRAQMIALSMVNTPTLETIDFFHGKFADEEQGIQARYGVGAAAFNLRDRRPEEAEHALQILTTELAGETDKANKAGLLVALGNAGAPSTVEQITPHLGDADPQIRRAATQALRKVPGDQIDGLLGQLLANDEVEMVRLSAIDALSERPITEANLNALVQVTERDPSEAARRWAQTALNEFASREPNVAAALERYRQELAAQGG